MRWPYDPEVFAYESSEVSSLDGSLRVGRKRLLGAEEETLCECDYVEVRRTANEGSEQHFTVFDRGYDESRRSPHPQFSIYDRVNASLTQRRERTLISETRADGLIYLYNLRVDSSVDQAGVMLVEAVRSRALSDRIHVVINFEGGLESRFFECFYSGLTTLGPYRASGPKTMEADWGVSASPSLNRIRLHVLSRGEVESAQKSA